MNDEYITKEEAIKEACKGADIWDGGFYDIRNRNIEEAIRKINGGIKMEIAVDPCGFMPIRAHEEDAGLDIMAMFGDIVPAHGSKEFHTGVHIKLPHNTAGILISKSGLNIKHNITSTGLIDEGYTGEIVVKLFNHGDEDYKVHFGDKISQLVIVPVFKPYLELVKKIEDTSERGSNGFGSSGR